MRIGDIGWLAAVVLAAMASAASVQAAAPPAGVVVTMDPGEPLNPLEMLPVKLGRSSIVPVSAEVTLPYPPGFTSPTARELTIVVRLEEQPNGNGRAITLSDPRQLCFCFPPSHAIHPESSLDFEGQVLDSLQKKLMELHEKGFFEVEFSPRGDDRTEMRIRYIPVYENPVNTGHLNVDQLTGQDSYQGQPFNFFIGFCR
jgi:hypothetical protein